MLLYATQNTLITVQTSLKLNFQDIFNIKLTGVDTFTEERLKSRVTSYRVLAAHSDLTGKLDEKSENRGENFSWNLSEILVGIFG